MICRPSRSGFSRRHRIEDFSNLYVTGHIENVRESGDRQRSQRPTHMVTKRRTWADMATTPDFFTQDTPTSRYVPIWL